MTLRFIVPLAALAIAVGCRSGPPRTEVQEQATGSSSDRPLTVFSQEITSPITELDIARGQKTTIPVTIKNTGPEPWRLFGVSYPVTLSYKWYKDGKMLPYEGERTILAIAELKPGEAASSEATVLAPDKETGKMTLEFTMVQEGVGWFSLDRGATPLRITATVK